MFPVFIQKDINKGTMKKLIFILLLLACPLFAHHKDNHTGGGGGGGNGNNGNGNNNGNVPEIDGGELPLALMALGSLYLLIRKKRNHEYS
jgi:hypothetical protein